MKRFILAICILTAVVSAFAQRDYYIGVPCNIHLYGVESNEEKNLAFTTYQAKRLGEYFTYEDTLFERNCLNGIIPHGTYNPLFKNVPPDSSNRIYMGRTSFYLRECVIVELIQPKPLHTMAQKVGLLPFSSTFMTVWITLWLAKTMSWDRLWWNSISTLLVRSANRN